MIKVQATSQIIYEHGYKYKLKESVYYPLPEEFLYAPSVGHQFIGIAPAPGHSRVLFIKHGYAWDGASGPALDTPSFMRASLIHDAVYQLLREKLLPRVLRAPGNDIDVRLWADQEMRRICLQDGMNRIRAWWVYRAVRKWGLMAATQPRRVYRAPR